jgi:hypothetical protein
MLSMSRTIPGMVQQWSLLHILGSISTRVPGARSFTQPFHSFQQVEAVAPFLASTLPASLAFLLEMGHGDNYDKCPRSEGSNCGSRLPPPHYMTMVLASH